jgi:4-hydroxybenzoate polyprenyltransferase
MWSQMRKLLEMIRFSHTLFAMPFAMLSALLAWQTPGSFRPFDLVGILLCLVFARSAAMAFNRLADRTYDAQNPRTASRHLPSGQLTMKAVAIFLVLCSAGFVATTGIFWLSGNPWPLYLSVPVLLFILGYSYAKRFTFLCHVWLGTALFLAPVAAWIAIRGLEQLATPVVLGLAVLFWVSGFDILYACQDVDFDRRARLHSLPAKIGVPASLRLAAASHGIMVCCLIGLYWAAAPYLGAIYIIGVGAVAILLTYEHWIVRPDDLSRINQAFFHVNGVISLGLLAVVALQLLLSGRGLAP